MSFFRDKINPFNLTDFTALTPMPEGRKLTDNKDTRHGTMYDIIVYFDIKRAQQLYHRVL